MTSFGKIFNQMFLRKSHFVHLILLIQLFSIIFLSLLILIQNPHGAPDILLSMFPGNRFWTIPFSISVITTVFADLTLCGLMCWQNQKINISTTWHLAPISENKVYLSNILSSLAECVYIFIIQFIWDLIIGFIFESTSGRNMIDDLAPTFSDASDDLELIIFLIALVLIIFTFVDFVNFSSHAISDFLPVKNAKWVRILIVAILIIIAAYLFLNINSYIQDRVNQTFNSYVELWTLNVEYLCGAIIFGILNLWLKNKYVETKN